MDWNVATFEISQSVFSLKGFLCSMRFLVIEKESFYGVKSDLPVSEIVMGFNLVTREKSFQNSQMSTCVLCSCLLPRYGVFFELGKKATS